jgi:hypothetical protein
MCSDSNIKESSLFLCSTQLHTLFKNRLTLSSYLIECERLSAKVEVQDAQKLQLLKQHYHEMIEAKNKEIRENENAQELLQKSVRVMLK